MIRPLSFVCLVLVWMAVPLSAQNALPVAKPADVGLSADVLKEGVELYAKAVADDELRGAVLLVARRGKIVLHEAIGARDVDKKLPMEKETLFHVASNTKPIVAAAILMLSEEGKLGLDDEVGRHLPAFANDKCKAIKVRHLLSHTSGFRIPTIFIQPIMTKSVEHPDAPNLQLEVARFAAVGPQEKPGLTYSYNNPGYNTLGALIEVASKQPLEEFLTKRIYQPLGMNNAYHQDHKGVAERRSCIYSRKSGEWKRMYQPGDPPRFPVVRASGGLITSAADYARFLQMVLNGGTLNDRRLLKAETVQLATTPQTRSLYTAEEQKERKQYYGFGWQVSTDGVFAHGGSDGTYAWVDPKNEIVGIVFTQSPGGRLAVNEFKDVVRRALLKKAE